MIGGLIFLVPDTKKYPSPNSSESNYYYHGFPIHGHSEDFLSDEESVHRFKLVRFYILILGAPIVGVLSSSSSNQNQYCLYHQNKPLSCKPSVKLQNGLQQDWGNDNNRPSGDDNKFDPSNFRAI